MGVREPRSPRKRYKRHLRGPAACCRTISGRIVVLSMAQQQFCGMPGQVSIGADNNGETAERGWEPDECWRHLYFLRLCMQCVYNLIVLREGFSRLTLVHFSNLLFPWSLSSVVKPCLLLLFFVLFALYFCFVLLLCALLPFFFFQKFLLFLSFSRNKHREQVCLY